MRSIILRPKNPTLILYATVNYIFPWLASAFSNFRPVYYKFPYLAFDQFVYGSFLVLIVLLFGWLPWERRELMSKYSKQEWESKSGLKIPSNLTIALLSLVVILSLIGKVVFLLDGWRYSDAGISEGSYSTFALTIFYILGAFFLEFLLFIFLFLKVSLRPFRLQLIILQLNLGLALTVTGLGPAIYSAISAALLLGKDTMRQFIFVTYGSRMRINKTVLIFRSLLLLILILALCVALVYGESVKTGQNLSMASSFFTDKSFTEYWEYLVERFSVNFYSLRVALDGLPVNHQPLDNLMIPFNTILYRLSSLVGGLFDIEKSSMSSISFLNYNLINYMPLSTREGTSPGLIASFLICLPTILAPFGLILYLSIYNQIQKRLRRLIYFKLSFMGELILLMFTSYFFASPFDMFLIFDNLTIAIVAYACLSSLGKVEQYPASSVRIRRHLASRSQVTRIR